MNTAIVDLDIDRAARLVRNRSNSPFRSADLRAILAGEVLIEVELGCRIAEALGFDVSELAHDDWRPPTFGYRHSERDCKERAQRQRDRRHKRLLDNIGEV